MGELRAAVTLYRAHSGALDLDGTLAAAAQRGELVGFVYAPKRALWVRLVAGALEFPPGEARPDAIFELRLFDRDREWRWVKGQGAACLSESPLALPGWTDEAPIADCEAIERNTLLWGRIQNPGAPGWSRLGAARTGTFDVPLNTPEKTGVALCSRVYLAIRDDHGNVGVVEERMLALTTATNASEAA